MTARDFAYWLQGLFELGNPNALDEKQTDLVKRHLALVFIHDIDPKAGGPELQKILHEIHDGDPPRPALHLDDVLAALPAEVPSTVKPEGSTP